MDFSSSKTVANESREDVKKALVNLSIPQSPPLSSRVEKVCDDFDMTDWLTPNATERWPMPPVAPQPEAVQRPFDFGLKQDHGHQGSLADEDSPTSLMGSAWDWDIGIALSPPALPVEDEMDDGAMMWDGGRTVKGNYFDKRLGL